MNFARLGNLVFQRSDDESVPDFRARARQMKRLLALVLLLLAFCCWQPLAAYAQNACTSGCVNWNGAGFLSGTTAPSSTITVGTTGDSIHAWFYGQGPTSITSVTVDGTAVILGSPIVNVGPGTELIALGIATNVASGSHTVVFNTVGSCTTCTIIITEWSGNKPIVAQNGAESAGGVSVPATGGNVTGTATGILETYYTVTNGAGGNPTIPTGTSDELGGPVAGVSLAWQASAATTYNPSWTTSSGGDSDPVVMSAIFQTSSSAPPLRSLMGVGK